VAPLNDSQIGIVRLGSRPYAGMSETQAALVERRRSGEIGDLLLILEHPATYTKGRRTDPTDLLLTPEQIDRRGIAICDTPRGGKVTYHGPGQLIVYPIVDLRGLGDQPEGVDRIDVAAFVHTLELAMSAALRRWDVEAATIDGLTGLWVSSAAPIPAEATAASMASRVAKGEIRKIGSIGLRISRGISSHGLSLNVSCDLAPFRDITSCGIEQCQVSSIALESGGEAPSVETVGLAVCGELASRLGRDPVGLAGHEVGLESAATATA
jgi:lipoyl(octanoyl) transferase